MRMLVGGTMLAVANGPLRKHVALQDDRGDDDDDDDEDNGKDDGNQGMTNERARRNLNNATIIQHTSSHDATVKLTSRKLGIRGRQRPQW